MQPVRRGTGWVCVNVLREALPAPLPGRGRWVGRQPGVALRLPPATVRRPIGALANSLKTLTHARIGSLPDIGATHC